MKNIFKILLVMILSFSLSMVYASQEEIDNAKKATEEYCEEDKEKKGCIYDSNNILYTDSGTVRNENAAVSLTLSGRKLVRGYQAADANGNMVFAGCYKANVSNVDYWGDGDYYIFKVVKFSGSSCSTVASDIVPAKGTKWKFGIFNGEYDGNNGIGNNMATYEGWTAKNGGGCPLMFGLTANTRWYTSSKNTYVFSDDAAGFNLQVFSFFGDEEYKQSPGCTIMDKDGHEEAEECFNNAASKIESYSCPSDMSKLSEMATELEKYQTECKSEFKKLYSKGLLESEAEEFSTLLKNKAKEKINSCQYSKCNISSTQIQKIIDAKAGTKCEKGCSISMKEQSEAENAQCYCCGGSRGCSYTWTDKPSSSCSKSNKTKDKCVGTTDTDVCLTCLEDAYKKAGLTSAQKKCMIESDIKRAQAESKVTSDIDKQFDDQVQKDLEENRQTRDEIENYEFSSELPAQGFGKGGESCEAIVGPNIAKLIKMSLNILRIIGAIIAIVNGMMTLIPAVVNKDPEALKKAGNKCVKIAAILLVIGVFPSILRVIGKIFGYDLSCIFG
jgi:hypothetical protein